MTMDEEQGRALTLLYVEGGVWGTAPITEQPELTIESWSVRQLPDGDRHFVVWCKENREGRVSSAIVEFDARTRRGRSASGRVYELSGPPGRDSDAEYVWQSWLRINDESEWTDVSAEVTAS